MNIGILSKVSTSAAFNCTANEGPVGIQYKYLVLIYVYPEMKLCGLVIFKTELEFSVFRFPDSCIVSDLYIPRIGVPFLLQPNRQTDPGNIYYNLLTDT